MKAAYLKRQADKHVTSHPKIIKQTYNKPVNTPLSGSQSSRTSSTNKANKKFSSTQHAFWQKTESGPRPGSASTRAKAEKRDSSTTKVPSSFVPERALSNNLPEPTDANDKLQKQCELQKKTISAFKDQVAKLKALLQACSEENEKLVKELAGKQKLESEVERLKKELAHEKTEKERLKMEKEVQEKLTKKLNEKISGIKLRLKDKGNLKEEFSVNDKSVEYYKDLSNKRLKESMQLAEQLICMRSDLERKSMELLKYQKSNSSYYSEPLAVGMDRTPRSEIVTAKKGSVSTTACNAELPPEPQTHRPKPYPLLQNGKSPGSCTPTTSKRSTSTYGTRQNSSRGQKLQPPNIPYQTTYHPHK